MEKTGMTFTRKALYDMLSQTTIRQVATDWHLDLRSLIDVIKANDIPCCSEASWIASVRGTKVQRRFLDGDPDVELYIPYSMEVYPYGVVLSHLFGVQDQVNEFDDVPISVLELMVRSQRCLEENGIKTVYHLMHYTINDLFNIKHMGMTSVENIVVACGEYLRKHEG